MRRLVEGQSTHWFKYTFKGLVCDPVLQRDNDGISLLFTSSLVFLSARTGKVFAVLVKTASHDTIRGVKSLLDAITLAKRSEGGLEGRGRQYICRSTKTKSKQEELTMIVYIHI